MLRSSPARLSHGRFRSRLCVVLLGTACLMAGCARPQTRQMLATAYCGCGECNGYTRGSWKFLKLDFWNRYVTADWGKGQKYTGRTANGMRPHPPRPGLLSWNTLVHPWMAAPRLLLPWLILRQPGTIAADTDYYPFGTEMVIPGWGWGRVEDRGSAIQGPDRIDLFHRSHGKANDWGRRWVTVEMVD